MIGDFSPEIAPQLDRELILRRARDHIGRRTLQHGDVPGGLGHLRHQRHGGRARADHHHALAGIVEIFRPFLRMDDPALEIFAAQKFRRIAFLVSVIARAHEQEIAGEADGLGCALARGAFGFHGPARVTRRPRRALDLVMKADVLVDAVLGGGLADVVQNPRPVRDRLRLGPRLERIAEREHVAVGADAGIAEQVPGAADAVAALEDDKALGGAFVLQMIARADAGEPGADDQDVEMFGWHFCLHVCLQRASTMPAGERPGCAQIPNVIRGLDPRIHLLGMMDCRVKPGNDELCRTGPPVPHPALTRLLTMRTLINTGNDPP